MLLEEWNVLEEQLLLQILRARGYHHPFPRQNSRNKVGEGFARAGAGLDDQMLLIGECGFHRFGHFELAWTELIFRMPFREQSFPAKELLNGQSLRGSRHVRDD